MHTKSQAADNGKLSWVVLLKQESSQGGTVTVVYKGTLETDTKMSGSVTAVEYGIDGEFKATKSKQEGLKAESYVGIVGEIVAPLG